MAISNPVYKKKKKKSKAVIISLAVGIFIIIAFLVIIFGFHVREVSYSGNNYYSEEELNQELLTDGLSGNALYVFFKYNFFETPNIPFVQKVQVRLKAPWHVELQVVEKVTAGCFEYMGTYMYFDNMGVVVESSSTLNEGTPIIKGLVFDHVVVGEKLSVEDDSIFQDILELSQHLTKKRLNPDSIEFGPDKDMMLTFGKARIYLGDEKNLKLKISDLATIIDNIKDLSGELHMENYAEGSTSIAFIKDKEPESKSAEENESKSAEENESKSAEENESKSAEENESKEEE